MADISLISNMIPGLIYLSEFKQRFKDYIVSVLKMISITAEETIQFKTSNRIFVVSPAAFFKILDLLSGNRNPVQTAQDLIEDISVTLNNGSSSSSIEEKNDVSTLQSSVGVSILDDITASLRDMSTSMNSNLDADTIAQESILYEGILGFCNVIENMKHTLETTGNLGISSALNVSLEEAEDMVRIREQERLVTLSSAPTSLYEEDTDDDDEDENEEDNKEQDQIMNQANVILPTANNNRLIFGPALWRTIVQIYLNIFGRNVVVREEKFIMVLKFYLQVFKVTCETFENEEEKIEAINALNLQQSDENGLGLESKTLIYTLFKSFFDA